MSLLRCPLCSEILTENPQGLACTQHHQFDRAKEGYFNLLPVHFKQSREPGDPKLQLQARRLFLQAGYYLPLRQALQALLPRSTGSLLDLGCGEGYFTQACAEQLAEATVYGVDIAKEGVRMAARRARQAQQQAGVRSPIYMVASAFDVPLVDASVDVITRIYAPSCATELLRLLKPGGLLVLVTPGQDHLLGLRQRIYAQVRAHPEPELFQGFTLEARQRLNGALSVPAGELSDALLAMTPFAWRISQELQEAISLAGVADSYDFTLSCYRRH